MRRIASFMLVLLVGLFAGCSGSTSNNDNGGGSGGDTSKEIKCATTKDCESKSDTRQVCYYEDATQPKGRCVKCAEGTGCDNSTVCWMGGDNPECVTDCTNDSSVCGGGESCKVVSQRNQSTKGCVPN